MGEKILLINSPYLELYGKSPVKVGVPIIPSLTLATIAAPLVEKGYDVEILDCNVLEVSVKREVASRIDSFQPDYVGVTFPTPQYKNMLDICDTIKRQKKDVTLVGGGPHATALPEETLKESQLDIVACGEGDLTLIDILEKGVSNTTGVYFKHDGKIKSTPKRDMINNLDDLPMPAWNLFDLKKYKCIHLYCRKNPVGYMETSRGCPFNCIYCNKNIFGKKYRVKSPKRVVDEMEYMLDFGFKEIHIMDDGFSINKERAIDVCKDILNRGLNFPWTLRNGVRVDCVDREFFEAIYEAGCYRVSFGVESGDQRILDNVCKGTTLEQNRKAFKMAKDVGLETVGFFMIGLPGETEKTMKKTIEFAVELDPDSAKVTIAIPYPGTELYNLWSKKGIIESRGWTEYNFHSRTDVVSNPDLTTEKIQDYYSKFYRRFYFRPQYIFKRLKEDIRGSNLIHDVIYLLKTVRSFYSNQLLKPRDRKE